MSIGCTRIVSGKEAQRQSELLQAIFMLSGSEQPSSQQREHGAAWELGIRAYRSNAAGHAIPTLQAQFPTLLAMLGETAFRALGLKFWQLHPPRLGDLAWLGDGLPDFVAQQAELEAWPWLTDVAKLDWAIWLASGAAWPALSVLDLQRLATGTPEQLQLRLARSVTLQESVWPIVTIWQTHQSSNPDWEQLRRQMGQSEWALVWRPPLDSGLAVAVQAVDFASQRWLLALQQGCSLDKALDLAGDTFDFAGWLQQAVQLGWLDSVVETTGAAG